MAVMKVALLGLLASVIAGCGSNSADTDANTAGLKPALPAAKPGSVVDPPDPSKEPEGASAPRIP